MRGLAFGFLIAGLAVRVNATPESDSALLAAIEHEDKHAVEQALKDGANANAKDQYGQSALMLAARKGDAGIVGLLLQKGSDERYVTQDHKTVLMFAAESGNLALVKQFIDRGADVRAEATGRYGNVTNALTDASSTGNKPLLEYLVSKGLNPNDPRLCVATLSGVVQSKHKEAIDFLLARSTGTDCLGDALVESIRTKNKDLTTVLLGRGASINHVENKSHGTACVEATPLSAAVEAKDKNLIEHLVSKGADPNLPDCGDAGDPSAFRMAIDQGDKDLVAFLLSHNADPKSCLPYAGDVAMAKLLLDHGAAIDYAAKGTYTALMLAAQSGQKDVVQYLISKGANVNWRSNESYSSYATGEKPPTALSMAKENHHNEIVAMLTKAGAKD